MKHGIIRAGRRVRAEIQAASPATVAHPLGPPTLSGTLITVDTMLNQPTRITRMIMDLSLQRFIADRVFSSAGGVSGGAVIFDKVTANELYTDRDVERVAPGAEFPLVTSERLAPSLAEVEKWGGKVYIVDEARDRNNSALFTNQLRQLTNTIVRKINARAIQELQAAIASSGQTFVGHDWSIATPIGPPTAQSTAQQMPWADFAQADAAAEADEFGIMYDLLLLNPQEYASLSVTFGAQGLSAWLSAVGKSVYVSNRVPAGKGYFVASGQVGEMRVEKPLGTVTWREEETERTWVQASVRPLMFVNNDFAVLEVTGLAG